MKDQVIGSASGTNDTSALESNALDIFFGRVREILLNEDDLTSLGRIEVMIARSREDYEKNNYETEVAYPLNIYDYTLPAINESVVVLRGDDQRFYYTHIPPVNFWDQISIDDTELEIPIEEDVENVKVNHHSYEKFVVDDGDDNEVYGTNLTPEIIEATDVVMSRKVHEGDRIMQGRWGQSIKFTCKNELSETPWSLEGEDGQPVIAIRTGQEQLEDPTTDNSFIYLLSDQSFDFGDIEFSPESANLGDTMDAYVGGQVIIGADRLTLLSKADDISISSKNLVSISTAKWAVDFDVLMDQVKALATQLDALCAGKATLVTGVGPTGVGTNTADCAAIVSEIEGMEQ